ncbi:clumping factor A-like [Rhipicephalus sanguineus]|uniref:clumping factor A-like n=1 Tax=Rhipicephalus sanguineus TaxID=34632 RepID=UPI0020C46C3E|nr:clumping factor A-like [Rhipicephalus sanguineus]
MAPPPAYPSRLQLNPSGKFRRRAIIALKHLDTYFGAPLPVEATEALARSCGEAALKADNESADDACTDEVGLEARASLGGGPAPLDDKRRAGDASPANDGAKPRHGEANTALDDALFEDTAGDCDELETEVKKSRHDDAAAVKKRKKEKEKKGHGERSGHVEAAENGSDEKYADVDEMIVRDAHGDCQDGEEEIGESRHYEEQVGESQPGDAKVEESRDDQAAVVKEDKTNKRTKQQQNEHRDKRRDDKDGANAREAKRESDDTDNDRDIDNDNYKETDKKDADSGDTASDADDKTDGQNELKKRRSPAFNDYHLEEWPPPRRDRSWRLQRKNTTQRATQRNIYDNGTSTKQQRQRPEVYRDYSAPASSVGVVLHRALAVLLSRMNVVVNFSESGREKNKKYAFETKQTAPRSESSA